MLHSDNGEQDTTCRFLKVTPFNRILSTKILRQKKLTPKPITPNFYPQITKAEETGYTSRGIDFLKATDPKN